MSGTVRRQGTALTPAGFQTPAPLPAGQKYYDPARNVFNLKPYHLTKTRAKLAGVTSGSGLAHIACVGTSITAGQQSSNMSTKSWPARFREGLASASLPNAGTGLVMCSNANSGIDPRWTYTGTWSLFTFTGGARSVLYTSVGGTARFASDKPGTVFELWYSNATANPFTVSIDSGTPVTVTPTGGSALAKYTVTGLPNTPHTVVITANAAGSTYLSCAQVRQASGVIVSGVGIGAAQAFDLICSSQPYGMQKFMTDAVQPDLIILGVMTNEAINQTDPATFQTNMQTLITAFKIAGSDIVLMVEPPSVESTLWRSVLYGLATANDLPMVDMFDRWGSSSRAVALGMVSGDGIHPSDLGYEDMAQGMLRALGLVGGTPAVANIPKLSTTPPASLLRQAAPTSPAILWGDNFAGTAGTTLAGRVSNVGASSATWNVVSGTWQIDGAGNVSPTTATDGVIATITMPSTVNPTSYSLSVDVKISYSGSQSNNPAIIFRYVDASNFWYFQPIAGSTTTFSIYEVIAGSHKQIAQFGIAETSGTTVTLRVDIWGRDVTLNLNGSEIYTFCSGPSGNSSPMVGVGSATIGMRQGISGGYATAAVYSNFRVTAYAGPKFNIPRLDTAPSTQVLTRSASGGWDDTDDNNPNVVWDPVNSRWVLYWSGFTSASGSTIQGLGLAYANTLDGPFIKDPANPIVPAAIGNVENGGLVYHFGRWIRVEDGGNWYTSPDLHTWTPLTVHGIPTIGDPFLRVNQNGLLECWWGDKPIASAIMRATSSDGGVNWDPAVTVVSIPAYTSTRGRGEPSVYVPPGKEGVEMMVFVDLLMDGGSHGVTAAAITIDNGATWHWHIVAGGSGSGFDSYQIFDSFPVVDNGVFYMFHSGATLAGTDVNLNTNIGRRAVQWNQQPIPGAYPMPYQ